MPWNGENIQFFNRPKKWTVFAVMQIKKTELFALLMDTNRICLCSSIAGAHCSPIRMFICHKSFLNGFISLSLVRVRDACASNDFRIEFPFFTAFSSFSLFSVSLPACFHPFRFGIGHFSDLSRNRLAKVTNGAFVNLSNLTYLDLSYNKLVKLESASVEPLKKLHTLNISGNIQMDLYDIREAFQVIPICVRIHLWLFDSSVSDAMRFNSIRFGLLLAISCQNQAIPN